MKFLKEYIETDRIKGFIEIQNPLNIDYYYKNRIPSKFDKWLGYDCGSIRYDSTEEREYYYDGIWEESWCFIGRQKDKKYYFMCTSASYSHQDILNKVIAFNTFREATYMIAFPGRGY